MKRVIITLFAVTCIFISHNSLAAREKPLYDPTFFQPSEEVVTPHISWLKPSVTPGPRVLFITHRKAMREVIELAQRMDMQYKVFACEKNNQFGETGIGVDSSWKLIQGNSAEELTEQLRKDLSMDWDVIVIGNIQWRILPIDCQYEIFKKVKAGTGLVGCIPKDGRDEFLNKLLNKSPEQEPLQLIEGIPWKSLPAFMKQKDSKTFLRSIFSTSSLGNGRICLINCNPPVHQMLTPGPTGRIQA
ncbi:MAG: hypothetical protein PHR77_02630 [Kiritimatiellae bacterium]|nr:hypothetical protein [Kiritimatiellia bacterium]